MIIYKTWWSGTLISLAASIILVASVTAGFASDSVDPVTDPPGVSPVAVTTICESPCRGKICPADKAACCCNGTGAWVCSCKISEDCTGSSHCR